MLAPFRIPVRIGAFVGVLYCATALGADDETAWREEVVLATGKVVTVDRRSALSNVRAPGDRRGAIRFIRIVFPKGAPIWEGDAAYRPLSIEIRGDELYVAVNIQNKAACEKYSYPKSSVIFFHWTGSAWVQVPKEKYPSGGTVNLVQSPWGRTRNDDLNGLVTIAAKKKLNVQNRRVGQPFDQVLLDRTLDACAMLKS